MKALSAAVVFAVLWGPPCAADDLSVLVARAFPPVLSRLEAEHIAAGGRALAHGQSFEVFSTGAGRAIIAAYTNGIFGRVRVLLLDESDDIAAILEPDLLMGGESAEVELVDLSGDGRPEIIVKFTDAGFPSTWLFAWSNGRLDFLSAAEDDPTVTELALVILDDVTADGVLEVIDTHLTHSEEGDLEGVETLYSLRDGTLVRVGRVLLRRSFLCKEGKSDQTSWFTASTPRGEVWLLNGAGKDARATSAAVMLNGTKVLEPGEVNEHVGFLKVPVPLSERNELAVRLGGAPGRGLELLVLENATQ